MNKGDLVRLIHKNAQDYRTIANASLRRSAHNNNGIMENRDDLPQEVVDALLFDFVGYVAGEQEVYYDLHISDFYKEKKK